MFDIIIRGGEVVTPQATGAFDIAIKGEKIAAVSAPGPIARRRLNMRD